MTNGRARADPVDLVELRIERRRAQLLRDWEETRAYLAQKNRWTPLAALAGLAALGFGLARARSAPPNPGSRADTARGGLIAAIGVMLGAGFRFALSPRGRTLWAAFKRARAKRQNVADVGHAPAP
jgi:hypothetical protein